MTRSGIGRIDLFEFEPIETMNRNDPPEIEELPECCNELMDFDEATGVCSCAICGRQIEPMPDFEPMCMMPGDEPW